MEPRIGRSRSPVVGETHGQTRRYAFSLVELLVALALIGILTSLLLPAVQAAREAARRQECANNLRQLPLAAHNFEDAHRHLPAGLDLQHVGPIVHVLPYVEQSAYHEGFSFDKRFVYWWLNPVNRPPLVGPPGSTRLLPARPPATAPRAGSTYFSVPLDLLRNHQDAPADRHARRAGQRLHAGSADRLATVQQSARTDPDHADHYAAVAGDWYFDGGKYRGVFRYRNGLRLTDVRDGTSNTLMFGEAVGGNVLFAGRRTHCSVRRASQPALWLTDGLGGAGTTCFPTVAPTALPAATRGWCNSPSATGRSAPSTIRVPGTRAITLNCCCGWGAPTTAKPEAWTIRRTNVCRNSYRPS